MPHDHYVTTFQLLNIITPSDTGTIMSTAYSLQCHLIHYGNCILPCLAHVSHHRHSL